MDLEELRTRKTMLGALWIIQNQVDMTEMS